VQRATLEAGKRGGHAGRETPAHLSGTFPITLIGAGGGSFEATLPRETPVAIGDGAFAFDSARAFAVVGALTPEGEGVLKVYLRLPLNIFEVRTVLVAP